MDYYRPAWDESLLVRLRRPLKPISEKLTLNSYALWCYSSVMNKSKTQKQTIEASKRSLRKNKDTKKHLQIKSNKKRSTKREANLESAHQVRLLHEIKARSKDINQEIYQGLHSLIDYPKTVTVFGSARLKPNTKPYKMAVEYAASMSEHGYDVITGGGPGIMEAANKGTYEASGEAVGFGIELPHEQNLNKYVTHGINFTYFFTRKLAMNFSGSAYVCFPGGFGTMDEFFQILTLVQTKKVQKVPIILVGKDFWQPIEDYSKNVLFKKYATISASDLNLFTIVDSAKEAVELSLKAKLRTEYYS